MKPSKESIRRDRAVRRDNFQCGCGCDLELTVGDLEDATKLLARLGAAPRYIQSYTPTPNAEARAASIPEPTEGRPCGKCRMAIVEIPLYAVELLRMFGANWPHCARCR